MKNSNYRVHYNFNDKTQSIDFSIPETNITEETKNETAQSLIKEKYPEFAGKTFIITKVNVFK